MQLAVARARVRNPPERRIGVAHGSSGIMQDVMSRCDQRHPGLRRM